MSSRADAPAAGAAPPARPPGRVLRFAQTPWAAALLGALCYLNTLGNDFVYDDIYIVRDNPRIRSLDNVRELWLADWWHPQNTQVIPEFHRRDRLYRPLTLFTFAVDYKLFGGATWGYHATNIGWHAAACALFWLFAMRLLGDRAIATIAALWFAVHPIHCEAVAGIVGRAEVLAGVFLLAGLGVLLPANGRPGVGRGLAAAGFFLLALLSKETAVCYGPVAVLTLILRRWCMPAAGAGWRWWTTHALLLLLPIAVYLPLRYVALDGHLLRDRPPSSLLNPLVESDLPERLVDAGTVLGHYARLIVAPSVLSSNYGANVIDPKNRPELMTWIGLIAAIALFAGMLGFVRRAGPWPRIAALCAMLVASYVLVSNTAIIIGVSVAERVMYWPSAPAILLLATLLVAAWRRYCQTGQKLAGAASILRIGGLSLLVALGLRTVVRNMDWASNVTLFSTDVQTFPQSVHLNNGVAREHLVAAANAADAAERKEHLAQALAFIDQALLLMPNDFDSLYVRGHILAEGGHRDEAIATLDQALLFNPFDKQAQALLAVLRNANATQRIASLKAALATQPADATIALELGRLLLESARPVDALEVIEPLSIARPNDPQVLELLVEALAVCGQYSRAIAAGRHAIAVQPDNWRVLVRLTWLLSEEVPDEALRYALEAHRLQPGDFRTNWNLAEAYVVNKRYREALELFERIRAGLPPGDPYRQQVDVRLKSLRERIRDAL